MMERKTREIPVKEIFWRILFGWRGLLASALIGAVVVAAIFYLRDNREYDKYQERQGVETDTVEKTDADTEEEILIQNQAFYQSLVDAKESYIENSIKMAVNGEEEAVLELIWYIESEYETSFSGENSLDYTMSIVDAYENFLKSGSLIRIASEDIGCDSKYVTELLEIILPSSGTSTVFGIRMIFTDQGTLEQIADTIWQEMQQMETVFSNKIGKHSLVLLSKDISVEIDNNLEKYQQGIYSELDGLRATLAQITETLSQPQASDKQIVVNAPKISITNVMLGFVIGVFLRIIWLICKVLFSPRLQIVEELEEIYKLRLLGIISDIRVRGFIDRGLFHLKNRNREHFSEENALKMTVSNIELACQRKKTTKVYFTSSNIERIHKAYLEAIIEELKKCGIEAVYGENINYIAAAVRQMEEIGTVVIFEQTDVSLYQEIDKTLKTLNQQEVEVIGGIGINTRL